MTDTTVVQPAAAPAAQPAAPAAPAEPPRKSLSEIAKQVFGEDFHGEVNPASTDKVPAPDDTKEGEAPLEEPTEGEEQATVEEPEEGSEATAPEDTGETPIATVSELVEHLEADPDWFNSLKVPLTVDGTPTEATIGDLVKNYQVAEAAEHRLEAAKQIAQKERDVWAAKQQELEGQYLVAAELIKTAEMTLDRDVQAIDPKLRAEDPAEWAARVQEFQHRRGLIERMKRDTFQNYQASVKAKAEQFREQKQRYTDEQRVVLLEKLPEWRDEEKATAEKAQLADYLYGAGFAFEDLDNLVDHRQLLLARKAMLYDQSRGKVDTAKKRVAKVPVMMKSSAPKSKDQLSTERLEKLRRRSAETGTVEDALAYRMAKRGVSR